ncbi:MAG: imidazolonepropionase [Deltaproteobacteria bacterium]|nr:imidazolonepropionase [Deltaproteobacteria bacterium]
MSEEHGPGLLVENIGQLVTCAGDRAGGAEAALGLQEDAVVHCSGGKVDYAGPRAGLPRDVRSHEVYRLDAGGGLVTPGFVDPHTHLAFAGDRAAEFAERCAGVPYLEILKRGGGILSTVDATRRAEEELLAELAEHRLRRLLEQGVTCVEVKSGYGLSTGEELKLLRAIEAASRRLPGKVVSTLLGAHALPREFEGRREAYVDLVCEEMIPAAAEERLAAHVDAFVEEGAFTAADARRIAKAAADRGLGLRLHVDQLTAGGGAELAADLGALSADHLEQISPAGVKALASSGCAAGLLPTATLYARLTTWAPGRALCDEGAVLALGTNLNPGTAMSDNHALALGLACLWNGLTPAEALLAATDGAARSLGLGGEVGRLVPGARADLVVHHATDYRQLAYHLGVSHVQAVVAGGHPIETTHTPG